MTDLVDHLKAQPLSEKEAALSDVSHDYWKNWYWSITTL